jgi:hypothetical protein
MFQIIWSYKRLLSVAVLVVLISGTVLGFYAPKVVGANIKPSTPSETISSGCWITYCAQWVGGHEDQTCVAIGLAACSIIGFDDPLARAACIGAVYAGCYVPAYRADYEQRWYDPCPQ